MRAAAALGLPLVDLDTIERVDQVAPDLAMIKGRGALTREKKLAAVAAWRIYAIDSDKQMPALGETWLPVEVLTYGWRFTLAGGRAGNRRRGAPARGGRGAVALGQQQLSGRRPHRHAR